MRINRRNGPAKPALPASLLCCPAAGNPGFPDGRFEPGSSGFCESRVNTAGWILRVTGRCARLRTSWKKRSQRLIPKTRVKPFREVVRLRLAEPGKFPAQDAGKTQQARKDAMPHERGSSPVLPFEFSSIALADRKIRFRRELPVTRPSSMATLSDLKKSH